MYPHDPPAMLLRNYDKGAALNTFLKDHWIIRCIVHPIFTIGRANVAIMIKRKHPAFRRPAVCTRLAVPKMSKQRTCGRMNREWKPCGVSRGMQKSATNA